MEEILSHYGILGMKWGVRHDREPSGTKRNPKGNSLGRSPKSKGNLTEKSLMSVRKHSAPTKNQMKSDVSRKRMKVEYVEQQKQEKIGRMTTKLNVLFPYGRRTSKSLNASQSFWYNILNPQSPIKFTKAEITNNQDGEPVYRLNKVDLRTGLITFEEFTEDKIAEMLEKTGLDPKSAETYIQRAEDEVKKKKDEKILKERKMEALEKNRSKAESYIKKRARETVNRVIGTMKKEITNGAEFVKKAVSSLKETFQKLFHAEHMTSNDLYHYGILGMKWGVRRTPEQLGHAPKSERKAFRKQLREDEKEYRKNRRAVSATQENLKMRTRAADRAEIGVENAERAYRKALQKRVAPWKREEKERIVQAADKALDKAMTSMETSEAKRRQAHKNAKDAIERMERTISDFSDKYGAENVKQLKTKQIKMIKKGARFYEWSMPTVIEGYKTGADATKIPFIGNMIAANIVNNIERETRQELMDTRANSYSKKKYA